MIALHMKKQFTLILSLIFSILSLSAKAQEDIDNIKKWHAEIEGNQALKSTTFSLENDGEEIGLKRFMNEKGEVVKVRLFAGGDHSSLDDIYYYKNGLLFFVIRTKNGWQFSDKKDKDGNPKTIDSAFQSRLYFQRAKILKILVKNVSSENAEAIDGMLAKAENREVIVNEEHKWIMNLAYAAKFVSSKSELETLSLLGR